MNRVQIPWHEGKTVAESLGQGEFSENSFELITWMLGSILEVGQ